MSYVALQMYRLVIHTFERNAKKPCLWKPTKLIFSTQVPPPPRRSAVNLKP